MYIIVHYSADQTSKHICLRCEHKVFQWYMYIVILVCLDNSSVFSCTQVWDHLWHVTSQYPQGVGEYKENTRESKEKEEGERGGGGVRGREWQGALQVSTREVHTYREGEGEND